MSHWSSAALIPFCQFLSVVLIPSKEYRIIWDYQSVVFCRIFIGVDDVILFALAGWNIFILHEMNINLMYNVIRVVFSTIYRKKHLVCIFLTVYNNNDNNMCYLTKYIRHFVILFLVNKKTSNGWIIGYRFLIENKWFANVLSTGANINPLHLCKRSIYQQPLFKQKNKTSTILNTQILRHYPTFNNNIVRVETLEW